MSTLLAHNPADYIVLHKTDAATVNYTRNSNFTSTNFQERTYRPKEVHKKTADPDDNSESHFFLSRFCLFFFACE